MSFQLSPGVQVQEIDLTNIVPAVATSIGGTVGQFQWGPVMEVQTIASEIDLIKQFGKPNSDTYGSFFAAANFLSYAANLLLVRVVDQTAVNAVASGTPIAINNFTDWEDAHANGNNSVGTFAAKYPGVIGNSLKVSMADSATYEKALTGTITTTVVSTTVTGSGTSFTTELHSGAILYSSTGNKIGTILTIQTDTSATLSAVALSAVSGDSAKAYWEFHDYFTAAPGTTDYAATFGGSNDELHVIVQDRDGLFTGVPGTILEQFSGVSKASDALTEEGEVNYYKEVLATSKYVWWMDHPANVTGSTAWGSTASSSFKTLVGAEARHLTGGLSGGAATDGEYEAGYDLFANAETVNVNLLFVGNAPLTVGKYVIENICEKRLDCIAFVSPAFASVYNNSGNEGDDCVSDRTDAGFNVNSSYGVMDCNWKYQYDKYNDMYRWLALNADIAGICALTDNTNAPWWSPAGSTRGQIKNVVKLAWNPSEAERDKLFTNSINPVITIPGEGTILFGDKTLLFKPSAFDAINVRRLFIVLEKSTAIAARRQLFEFNDEFTRAQFRSLVEPFLRGVKGARGITDFKVVCDASNNTGEIIDANTFVADIYVKPARAIRYIRLSFVAARSSVSFTEIVGQ